MEPLGRPNVWLHALVCTNARPPGGLPSCGPVGGADVHAALRAWVAEHRLLARIWVTHTGCLGWCNADGVTLALYPAGIFYRKVTLSDCPRLLRDHFEPLLARRGPP